MNLSQHLEAGRTAKPRSLSDEYGLVEDFAVSYTPVKAGVYNIYLFGVIVDPRQFIGPIEVLDAAGPNDVVRIHLSTPGGSLDATDTFLNSMHACEGRVVVHASGGVHSAGSVILLSADEFSLSENFNMLIHNGSCGAGGDFNKFVAHARHSQEYMERIMRTTYEGFLTPDEIEAMIEGKDFWLNREEFCARWEGRNTALAEMLEVYTLDQDEPTLIPRKPSKRKPAKAA